MKDLYHGLTHNVDGSFSSTKFWQMVGYIVASYIMVHLTYIEQMSGEYLLIYLGAVTAARSFQNYLVARGGAHEVRDPSTNRGRATAQPTGDRRGDADGPSPEELLPGGDGAGAKTPEGDPR